MNKFITTILTTTVLLSFNASSVLAQTASPSGTLRDSVKQKVEEELSQIKSGVAKKGFVGSITAKQDASLTITNLKSQPRTVIATTETVIKLANGKDGTLADLKLNDFAIAMGDVDSTNKMTAKRIVIFTSAPSDKRQSYFGTITKTTSNSFTIKTPKGETLDLKVSAGTKYNDKFKFSDLKVDSKVVVVVLTGGTTQAPTYTTLRVFLQK